ncbi:unnamed protein product [Amoebophrya sp. A120]|nr:unnamed protein product [Amoebophrya sp. A120]|eukprot:GSA120T00017409001.1
MTTTTSLDSAAGPLASSASADWVRQKAAEVFGKLDRDFRYGKGDAKRSSAEIRSWVDAGEPRTYDGFDDVMAGCPETGSASSFRNKKARFDHFGFLHLEHFASEPECEGMKTRMRELVEAWDPLESETFRTDAKQESAQGSSDYFLDSSNRTHFFTEVGARSEDTKELLVPRQEALNKVGHGIHVSDEVFRSYCLSDKMVELVKSLGWKNPEVPQSMYIFKQPRIGGEVTSHQDSTFLHTTPRQTCLGLWLALEPATLFNGCLWVRPFSHWEGLRRRFVRNEKHFAATSSAEKQQHPQMIFEDETPREEWGDAVSWEGGLPTATGKNGQADSGDYTAKINKSPEEVFNEECAALFQHNFVPVECAAGDLVVFPGTLDHLSLANRSQKSRHTFQLHLVEGPSAGVTWSASNWLQYPSGEKFLPLAVVG